MRNDSLDIFRYDLPLVRALRMGGQSISHRRGILVRLKSDGIEGWGEAAPLPGYGIDTLESALRDLQALAVRMMGDSRGDKKGMIDGLSSPSAQFAVDTALREIEARSLGFSSLCELLPLRRRRVSVARLPDDSDPPDAEDQQTLKDAPSAHKAAQPAQSRAHSAALEPPEPQAVKIKVGAASVEDDAAMVRSIRARLGDAVRIRVDANRAWDLLQAIEFVQRCEDLNLDYLEEPVRARDDLAILASRSPVRLAIDETLQEALVGLGSAVGRGEHLRDLLSTLPHVPVWVVKPTYVGSWETVIDIMRIADEQGRRVVLSSAFESGIGMRALVALAAASPHDDPAGLDTYERLAADVLLPQPIIRPPHVDVTAATSLDASVDVSSVYLRIQRSWHARD